MNNQPRIFRGRGGPNDRRLPKHNARRRKGSGHVAQKPQQNKYDDENADDESPPKIDSLGSKHEESMIDQDDDSGHFNLEEIGESNIASDDDSDQSVPVTDAVQDTESIAVGQKERSEAQDTSPSTTQNSSNSLQKEIQQLCMRIKNNRKSFSLASNDGLVTAAAYKENVLNAVNNCFNQWKSILRHYNDDVLSDMKRSTGQAIFELLQQALQTGPLKGSNPGYFKRCGSEIATAVHAFLCEIIANEEEAKFLCFTEKQCAAVDKWKKSALKASEKAQPPSKHVLQRQKDANKTSTSKKKK